MTLFDETERGQGETLRFRLELAHVPDKVWRALTEPELLAKWLLPAIGYAPTPGTVFQFQAEPVGGWDGKVHCRVLEVEAPRRLRYAWVVGDLDTVVTFTLAPTPTGSRLVVEQTGFASHQKRNFGGARYGWRQTGQRLVELLAALDPQPGERREA